MTLIQLKLTPYYATIYLVILRVGGYMIIKKIFNNNCVLIESNTIEYVVTGSGVGFQKKIGEEVDASRIEKKFEIIDEHRENFESLVNRVPVEYFNITRQIVEYASEKLNMKVDDKINISLTDHIAFAVKRANENISLPDIFSREVQEFYPLEYEIGKWALQLIEKETGVRISDEEISFISFHIINSTSTKGNPHLAQSVTNFIQECFNIIEETMNIIIDKSSISYSRMGTHLKYLAKRILEASTEPLQNTSNEFFNSIMYRFSNSKDTVEAIANYTKNTFNHTLTNDEKLYLSIHIFQLTNKS